MKLSTAVRFIAILVGVAAILGLIVFAVSLGNTPSGTGTGSGGGTSPFSALFPFLGGPDDEGTPRATGGGVTAVQTGPVPRLRQITSAPVSGARLTKDGIVRYIEKETGHVYDVHVDSFDAIRISNLTIPGIQRVIWAGDSAFVAQFTQNGETVQNLLARIATSTPESSLETRALSGFKRAATNADGTALLAVAETADGSRIESYDLAKGGAARAVTTSPIRSWLPIVAGRDFMLATAPATNIPGFLYLLDSGGLGTKIVGDVPSLMPLPSPDGRYIAYSGNGTSGLSLAVVDRKDGDVHGLPAASFAWKCAWFPSGETRLFCGVPDDARATVDSWLLGTTRTSDSAWVIDVESGVANRTMNLAEESGVSFDVVNASVSADGAYAIFQNKTDLSLWALRLAE